MATMIKKIDFIKYFGEFTKKNKTKKIHNVYLANHKGSEEIFLRIENLSTGYCLHNYPDKISYLYFKKERLERSSDFNYQVALDAEFSVMLIIDEIYTLNLEKQIQEETKHLSTAKTKLQKF